jgi:altered-inheritance-of-mitochondria protein 5
MMEAQLGGFTLTASILYLSTQLHTRNRVHQAALIKQQAAVLNNIVDPQLLPPPQSFREVRGGTWETAKDKWNAELENGVRRLQAVDWDGVRNNVEETVSALYRKAFVKAREVIPDPPK